ncbi:hypothetical protein ABZU76_08440 [Amycolatopsis sp. NPDC005232]
MTTALFPRSSSRPVARARLKSAARGEGGVLEFLNASGRYPKVTALVR